MTQTKITLNKKFFEEMGYASVRQLDDGTWIGLIQLLFTTGLCIGLDEFSWRRRYCYDDKIKLIDAYNKIEKGTDIPIGWIAKRPKDEI